MQDGGGHIRQGRVFGVICIQLGCFSNMCNLSLIYKKVRRDQNRAHKISRGDLWQEWLEQPGRDGPLRLIASQGLSLIVLCLCPSV